MLFLGLDLAWGSKNTSGACALTLAANKEEPYSLHLANITEALGDDDAILDWVTHWDQVAGQEGLILGIDAPLLVPNETGKRPCETELGRRFARYQAGAHPANRQIFHDNVRGERLVARLAAQNIHHDPYLISPMEPNVRRVMEVFPHPAHIIFFSLAKTLKYKAKPGRDYPGRWAVFQDYVRYLRGLETADPALHLAHVWPPEDVTGVKGRALKRYEDSLDALTCAYIAAWYWRYGAEGAEVIGDMAAGYIVVPKPL